MTKEEKMKIVINNYFKTECSVNTSIREAFEKGLRIGASKVQKKHGKWIETDKHNIFYQPWYECSVCGVLITCHGNYCPNCGARMER